MIRRNFVACSFQMLLFMDNLKMLWKEHTQNFNEDYHWIARDSVGIKANCNQAECERGDRARTYQSGVKLTHMQKLEEAGCSLPKDGLQITLDNLLRINTGGSYRDVMFETAVVKSLRKHLSMEGVWKLSEAIRAQTKDQCNCIEDRDVVPMIVKSTWTCEYGVCTLMIGIGKRTKIIQGRKAGKRIWSAYICKCLLLADVKGKILCCVVKTWGKRCKSYVVWRELWYYCN